MSSSSVDPIALRAIGPLCAGTSVAVFRRRTGRSTLPGMDASGPGWRSVRRSTRGAAMKTAGAVLDIATIRDLVRPLEPAASVYLRATTPDAALDSAEELAIRIRMVEERLRTQGADESTVEAVAAALARHPSPQAGVAVLATGGNVVLEHPLPDGTPNDRARFGAPADVIPLLSWLWRPPAPVLVAAPPAVRPRRDRPHRRGRHGRARRRRVRTDPDGRRPRRRDRA